MENEKDLARTTTESSPSAITICEGAVIAAEEVARVLARVGDAVARVEGAVEELMVKVTLHVHHEYPKVLYKGQETRSVADADQQAAAEKDGFGPYDHEGFTTSPDQSGASLIVTGTVTDTIKPGDKFSVASASTGTETPQEDSRVHREYLKKSREA
jgi:hypothetical protein